MSNIEKLLDQLLKVGGEKLIVGIEEPIYILKANQKHPLMPKTIGEKEFNFLEAEYAKIFNNSSEISHNGKVILSKRQGLRREFLVPGSQVQDMNTIGQAPVKEPDAVVPESMPGEEPLEELEERSPKTVMPPAQMLPFNLDTMLKLMIEKKASDLHLATLCKPSMRIDGDMVVLDEFPILTEEMVFTEVKRISPERNITEFNETNDTDFAYSVTGSARFRANLFRDIRGVGAVFRIIPTKILTIDDLQVPRAIVEMCEIPKGLILVTGPTGSGKSTTLAALIDHINDTQRKHIITIEDPVEFVHQNKMSLINQREIHTHTQSFKKALRAALREDPDIILVGEMRDLETIAIAIEMAVTGHLVFGTLHTSTAIGTVDRIIDQFPSDQQAQIKAMLSDALIGVVSQTLLKRKKGGRIGAYEVMVVTPAVTNLIREGKNYQIATLMQTGKGLGMQMINSHLLELTEKGIVDADEAISKAIDKENLRTLLRGKKLINDKPSG